MRSIIERAKSWVKSLQPCMHGGETWWVARSYGYTHENILDFSANVNPLGPPSGAMEAIKENLWQIPFYPDPDSIRLRKVIAQYVRGVSHDNVIVGNGSTELIHLFAEVFIEEGDEALIPSPTFGEYETAVRRAGGKPRHVASNPDLAVEPRRLLVEVGSATKMIFLCNPNNPTGALTSRAELLEMVEKADLRDVLVFLDETFIEFVDDGKYLSLADEVQGHQNLFILRSFTKIFGLTGLRVGYGISHKEVIDLLLRVKMPWNVNCLGHEAALASLGDENYEEETRRLIKVERDFLSRGLKEIQGFKVFPSHANFILIDIRNSGLSADRLKKEMLRYGILIRECSSFEGLDVFYIRVAVKTRTENRRLLEALREVVESPKRRIKQLDD